MSTTTYIAVARIERRIDGKALITDAGSTIDLTEEEVADLPAGAIRLPKDAAAAATDTVKAEVKQKSNRRGGRGKVVETEVETEETEEETETEEESGDDADSTDETDTETQDDEASDADSTEDADGSDL